MFEDEDKHEFEHRIADCKKRQTEAEFETRFYKHVESMSDDSVANLSRKIKTKICNKVVEDCPKIEADK